MEPHGSPADASEDLIGSATTVEEIISALARRGCLDLTSSINLGACSEFPCAGGGYCDVYRGALCDGTEIAIKSLKVYDTSERVKILKRAARELYYWSKLQHCNVLPLMGLTVFRGHISMVSRWMENGNLMLYLRNNPDANRIRLCMEICEGLCYIHTNGMVHGDLKAANVMVSSDGGAMIADFGSSQLRDLTLKFTNTAAKGGFSVRWAAPELLLADDSPQGSKETDVYAYGMTALEALTGKVPYEGTSDNRVIFLVASGGTPPRPDIDMCDELWNMLNSCWAQDSSTRPEIVSVRDRLRALFPPNSDPRAIRVPERVVSVRSSSETTAATIFSMYEDPLPPSTKHASPVPKYRSMTEPSRPVSMLSEGRRSREDTAKTFAERAWQEDPGFVEREKLAEWLGSPSEIRHQALTYYMTHFDFGNSKIDEAIRSLCNKLYIKGTTQQIDRILEAFGEHYISQNPSSIWKFADIVHLVSFAIILLNTDLQAAELNAHITSSRFVENTIDAVRTQLYQESAVLNSPTTNDPPTSDPLPDIDEFPRPHSPSIAPPARAASPPNVERRPPSSRGRLTSIGSIPLINRDSWVVASSPSDAGDQSLDLSGLEERWIGDISRELAAIYNRVRTRPILQTRHDDLAMSPQSKGGPGLLKRGSAKLYNSLRGESPYAQSSGSPSASGASFVSALGHRVSSSMSSLPHFLGITSNPSIHSSGNADSPKADSPLAKTGSLLWKSMKPTPGRIAKPKRWLSVTATVRSSIFDMTGPIPPGSNLATGRRLGSLSLLHTIALEVPAPKGAKVRSFGISLPSGETHMFEIQAAPNSTGLPFKSKSKSGGPDADAEVLAWVRACNYHAARYSRAPLPDAVTNVEYGWNGAATTEDDQASINGRSRSALIDDWVAPTLPLVEAQTDAETQIDAWTKQVDICNAEFAEHGELRGKMMNLYRPGSAQAQKALSNWEKKAQYLLTEIVKYETYAEILKNAEQAPPASP